MPSTEDEQLLKVSDLSVEYNTSEGNLLALDDFSLELNRGETYALVGESGAGKSTVGKAILGLIQSPGEITSGQILYGGKDLLTLSKRELSQIRGDEIAMIFQEPNEALNPVLTIGQQLKRIAKHHHPDLTNNEIQSKIIRALEQVQIPNPGERLDAYPVQFSGGMSQRVVIAMTILCEPNLLIADEPTTKLDQTIGAHVLDLLGSIFTERNTSILMVTHNMGIAANYCDRVGVMYAGKKVEEGGAADILSKPRHPYTKDLMQCIPRPDKSPTEKMHTIPGSMPTPIDLPNVCYYANRCSMSREECYEKEPPLDPVNPSDNHRTACYFHEELPQ
ncbi:ABC transporter ATP-binding protein [Natrialbaceae archaeon A-CW1-1]